MDTPKDAGDNVFDASDKIIEDLLKRLSGTKSDKRRTFHSSNMMVVTNANRNVREG